MKSFLFLIFSFTIISCSSKTINDYTKDNLDFYKEEIQKQGDIVVSSMALASRHLHDIAWKILYKNSKLCGENTITAFGIMVGERNDLPSNLKTSYSILFEDNFNKKFNNFPIVVSVAQSSPAEKRGIKEKDIIISVDGNETRDRIRNLLSKASSKGSLTLKVLRGNEELEMEVSGTRICGYSVQPLISPFPTAYADGSKIFVTLAALDFIKDDSELAFLIGHELAHNILHFQGEKVGEENFLPISVEDKPEIRRIGDIFIWESQSKETEADLKGIEYSYRAGYDPHSAANYFRRLSTYMPELIEGSVFNIHPGNAKRAYNLDKVAKRLKKNNN